MLGIEGYEPHWQHSPLALAAAHRSRFRGLVGSPLTDAWLMWDVAGDAWFAHGPVILGFDEAIVEVAHRKFDECAITWGQVDMSRPPDWPGVTLDWRARGHRAVRRVRGRRLRAVNIIERDMAVDWRPPVLHAVEFLFDGARLAIYNALDENGLSGADEVELPPGFWRRIPVT
ncbi:MAG TPA: hypothetical protein VES42_22615 [Pilimelia sp.]|nr:hypothetical protein [Pilimelia sp.]